MTFYLLCSAGRAVAGEYECVASPAATCSPPWLICHKERFVFVEVVVLVRLSPKAAFGNVSSGCGIVDLVPCS